MITISLCMIVRNEEAVLRRCLDCARQFADEIVIVDTGSDDDTVNIAREYTDKVYSFEWCDDFSAARNFAFSKGAGDYLMWLDADDVLDEANIAKLIALKESLSPEVDVVMLRYHVAFDPSGNPTFSYFRERLVRREKGFRWQEPVHEHLQLGGNIIQEEIAVLHQKPRERDRAVSTRNLEIYRGQEASGKELSTRGHYYYARELRTHGYIEEAVERYRRFLQQPDGWVEDRITAAGDLSVCLLSLGREREALEALYASFAEDLPRAEICCQLGRYYKWKSQSDKAVFWYETALRLPRPESWGFLQEDCWGYEPHMELCVLYDQQGNRRQALAHHQAAKKFKPNDPGVLHNQAYFYPQDSGESQ